MQNQIEEAAQIIDAEDTQPTQAEAAQTDSEILQPAQPDAVQTSDTKKKKQLPAGIKKIVDYLNAHEDVRQMVFFLMFSVLCGLSQMIVTYGLSAGLKLADGLRANFSWFLFKYDTTAEFIGFLVGSIVGQVLTFILNRKKTFNTTDHVAIRAVMYAILAIAIILMQTALGGVVTSACYNAKPDADGFLALLFNLTGLAVGGIAAVIVNFLGNKFLVMRDWGKKKAKTQATEAATDSETVQEETAFEAQPQEDREKQAAADMQQE